MPRREFQPMVVALEPRRTPSDTTGGVSVGPTDGTIIVATEPYSDEMPTGVDAFVPEGPFIIGYDSLIADVNGNLPGSPAYGSGEPGLNPEPPVYTDPNTPSSALPPSDADLDSAFQKMLDSLPPPR